MDPFNMIGEIFMGSDGENWEAVTAILLDQATVQEIGRQISR